MLVGIITLVLALTASYMIFVGIVLGLSVNKKFVKWYTKKVLGIMGDVMVDLPKDLGDMMQKLESLEETAE